MNNIRYAAGFIFCIAIVLAILSHVLPFFDRCNYVLVLSALIAMIRLISGPSIIDRVAAMKVISVIIINFALIMSVMTSNELYIDIAIAWAFQAFIGTLIFAKYTEGNSLDA
ncbi:MAG: monovalent cation/H+ antiporter complex subunit F [Endomicrobiales bacterium]